MCQEFWPSQSLKDGLGLAMSCFVGLLTGLRHTVEEINEPGLQRVLGTDDQESTSLDQLFEDFRSVP